MTTKSLEAPKATAKNRKPAAKKRAATATSTALSAGPSKEEITRLAEKYWAERGWPQGSPEQDWLRAEQELSAAS